jgi:hypothetical protein
VFVQALLWHFNRIWNYGSRRVFATKLCSGNVRDFNHTSNYGVYTCVYIYIFLYTHVICIIIITTIIITITLVIINKYINNNYCINNNNCLIIIIN